MTVAGIVTDHTAGDRSARLEFVVSDNRAEIREVLDATAGQSTSFCPVLKPTRLSCASSWRLLALHISGPRSRPIQSG